MKITRNKVLLVCIALAIIGTFLVFYLRSPVLLVVDEPFSTLYGLDRAKKVCFSASFSLKRPVKPVMVADDASTDVLVLTVEEASRRPYCVIFPYRYADSARRYFGQNPLRTVVLLAGRSDAYSFRPSQNDAESNEQQRFFMYNTDGTLDFYRLGRIAGIFGNAKGGEIPVFIAQMGKMTEQEAFMSGMQAESCESPPRFYTSFAQLGASTEFPVVVLAGSGIEYLERTPQSPVILFTWLDPALTSREIQVIFDDSPWAQLISAVKMAQRGKDGEAIPSKILIFQDRIADKRIIRGLRKAARSSLRMEKEQP